MVQKGSFSLQAERESETWDGGRFFFKTSRHPSSDQIHKRDRRQAPHDGFMKQCKRTGDTRCRRACGHSPTSRRRGVGRPRGPWRVQKKLINRLELRSQSNWHPSNCQTKLSRESHCKSDHELLHVSSRAETGQICMQEPLQWRDLDCSKPLVNGQNSCTSTCRAHTSTPKLRGQCWCVCR